MIKVDTPTVYRVQQPHLDVQGVKAYLTEVGGLAWYERVVAPNLLSLDHTATLVEFMGRLCYKSWEPGLNRNVTKIREDQGDYLLNVLRSEHGSVLSHAHWGFAIHDGSRVFTAEMNRHAVGTDISEQSLRYVRLDELRFRPPPTLKPETQQRLCWLIEYVEDEMGLMMGPEYEDLDNLDDFTAKKTITSALRRGVPMGISTEEGWTGNVRAIRHVIEMRTAPHAEEEIRVVAGQIAKIMQTECPLLFGDYTETDGTYETPYRKV
jgi:thymidylate synthase (FAD)